MVPVLAGGVDANWPTTPDPAITNGGRASTIYTGRIRTNEAARQRNKTIKSSLKTAVKKFRAAASSGDQTAAAAALADACRKLDKAASSGVIHKNQAANRKSAMARQLAKISA